MTEVMLGIVVFVVIVLVLASIVLVARAFLVPSGPVTIQINETQTITARAG
jgi:Na+-transporting NADH:ubiquinone oxidoreductase subunit F